MLLHHILKKFVPFVPSYIKDCFQVNRGLEELGTLLPETFIVKMGVTAVYTNISMYGPSPQSFGTKYDNACYNLPTNFPLDLAMHAMTLIMRFNVFEAGDTFHRQISGTAMSASSAVT